MKNIKVKLADGNFWFWVAAAALVFYSLFKTWALPSNYIASQYLFDLKDGFMKRALMGEVLGWIIGDAKYKYGVIFIVTRLQLICLLVAIFMLIRDVKPALRWASLPFFAGPGFLVIGNTIGSQEYINHSLVILYAILAGYVNSKFVLRLGLLCLGVLMLLVHEAALVINIPILCVAYAINDIRISGDLERNTFRTGFNATIFMVFFTLIAFLISVASTLPIEALGHIYDRVANKSDYSPVRFVFQMMTYTIADNVFLGMLEFKKPERAYLIFMTALASVPYLIFYLGVARNSLLKTGWVSKKYRMFFMVSILGASLAPYFLHLIGTDFMRWSSLVAFNGFLGCMLLLKYSSTVMLNAAAKIAIGLLVITGLLMPYPVYVHYTRWWPSDSDISTMKNLLFHGLDTLPRPFSNEAQCNIKRADGRWCDDSDPLMAVREALDWGRPITTKEWPPISKDKR